MYNNSLYRTYIKLQISEAAIIPIYDRYTDSTKHEKNVKRGKVLDNKLEKRPSKRGIFVASCADIANTLESRLRSELVKREGHKTMEVMILQITQIKY